MCPGTVFTSKIGLFQTGFSYCQKHLLDISNRFLGSWMLHLEYYRRRINSFQVVTTQAPPNMAGVTDTHRWFYVENLTFSNRFYILSKHFFQIFQMVNWYCAFKIIYGKQILYQGELARSPQTWQGLPLLVLQRKQDFFKQVSHCVKNIFIYFKLCTWLLHTHRLYEASGFFQGELSRAPQAWHWEEEKVQQKSQLVSQ